MPARAACFERAREVACDLVQRGARLQPARDLDLPVGRLFEAVLGLAVRRLEGTSCGSRTSGTLTSRAVSASR